MKICCVVESLSSSIPIRGSPWASCGGVHYITFLAWISIPRGADI